jgi:hypothetical protein
MTLTNKRRRRVEMSRRTEYCIFIQYSVQADFYCCLLSRSNSSVSVACIAARARADGGHRMHRAVGRTAGYAWPPPGNQLRTHSTNLTPEWESIYFCGLIRASLTSGNGSELAAAIHSAKVPSSVTLVLSTCASLTHSPRTSESEIAFRLVGSISA